MTTRSARLAFAVLVGAAALSAIGVGTAGAADPCDSAFKLRKYAAVAETCRTRAEAGDAEA